MSSRTTNNISPKINKFSLFKNNPVKITINQGEFIMKDSKIISLLFTLVLALVLLMATGCQNQEPLSSLSTLDNSEGSVLSFQKAPASEPSYPQTGSAECQWWGRKNIYRGAGFVIPNGSNFSLVSGALTPPPGTAAGSSITITMLVEKDETNNHLLITFGPHGCQFDPPVEVVLFWDDLGIDLANLYYIDDNGNYIQQNPDYIDIQNKKMVLSIPHFSRYAIGEMP
jgi:hypothetical protein